MSRREAETRAKLFNDSVYTPSNIEYSAERTKTAESEWCVQTWVDRKPYSRQYT